MKKQLTKEDLPVGTKVVPHSKTTGGSFDSCFYWGEIVRDSRDFLYVVGHINDSLVLSGSKTANRGSFYNYSDVTLYKPKVKRSEIIERLEKLESIVEDLTRPVELVHQEQAPAVSFDMALGKDFTVIDYYKTYRTLDAERLAYAEKFLNDEMKRLGLLTNSIIPPINPVAKVGNLYKTSGDIMFCCTKVEGRKVFGFGFGDKGVWKEDGNLFAEGQQYLMLSLASSEEWFERLEKEYYRLGYKKGVTIKYEDRPPSKIVGDPYWAGGSRLISVETEIVAGQDNQFYPVMQGGKWSEIVEVVEVVEESQYAPGTLGAFWDGEWDFGLSTGCVRLGTLEGKTKCDQFILKEANMCYLNFKPLKFLDEK